MSTFNVSLVNLPNEIELELATLIHTEQLGSFQSYQQLHLPDFFKTHSNDTNFIICYQDVIDDDRLAQLSACSAIPVVLITKQLDFELERNALANNINLLVSQDNPELISLLYGFIKQFKIYQQHHALVVDDSRVDAKVVANILASEFITSDIEQNPNNVINRLSSNKDIHIIILDYQMPDIDGCALMKKVREHFPERAFIFIGLTGNRNGALQFLHEGANNVFLKPVDAELFALTLRKAVFNFHQHQQQLNTLSNYKNIVNKISHDLRNPIYVLMNINDLFIDNQVQQNSLELVEKLSHTAKENLAHIFDNLLGYIEITSYKESPMLKACSLNSMIASQLFLESHQAKLKNIIMNQECDSEANAFCIPSQIELVITNLTNNAVKYSDKNSEIDIRLYKDKNDIIFEVEDSSPRISEDNFLNIFNNRQIKKSTSSDVDTQSFGLTFCKEIIEAHGGEIGVRPGSHGNIFYFIIPAEQQAAMRQVH